MYFSLLSIGLGAVLGAWLRWIIGIQFNNYFPNVPLGTILVNLIGAFIIGFAINFLANSTFGHNYKLFIITGFCGALTTFSTFSIEVVSLLQTGKLGFAVLLISIHIIGSLLFTVFGIFAYQLIK